MFTQNDIHILEAIVDQADDKKGIIKTKGTTKKEIIEKTKLSLSKVNNTLINFQAQGYIENALKVKNSNSYILTEKGLKESLSMKGMY